jgi:endonuclease YncB( thermonuclease family)
MCKVCEHGIMVSSATTSARGIAVMLFAILPAIASSGSVRAAGCLLPQQGEGRVADVVDGRSFHLADGREILLAGIEPAASEATKANRAAALSAVIAESDVTLRGEDDAPDRYGRQSAFGFLAGSETPVQALQRAQGAARVSADIADGDCAASLFAAEAEPRAGQRGIWASLSAIKNTESSDDILAGIGQFTVVEDKVLSVRQAGATTYLNFKRNWTRDFAVTISRRALPDLAGAGSVPKSLENLQIRIRGWVETRSGARMEVGLGETNRGAGCELEQHDPEVGTGFRKGHAQTKCMIRKSETRFSEKIMFKKRIRA